MLKLKVGGVEFLRPAVLEFKPIVNFTIFELFPLFHVLFGCFLFYEILLYIYIYPCMKN